MIGIRTSGKVISERSRVPSTIYRYELATGEKKKWLELIPNEQTAVHEILRALLTPDGNFYAYSYTHELSDLYIIKGLQ